VLFSHIFNVFYLLTALVYDIQAAIHMVAIQNSGEGFLLPGAAEIGGTAGHGAVLPLELLVGGGSLGRATSELVDVAEDLVYFCSFLGFQGVYGGDGWEQEDIQISSADLSIGLSLFMTEF
jgi:hypothetical protein